MWIRGYYRPPEHALLSGFPAFKRMMQPLETAAQVHQLSSAAELLELLHIFKDSQWAFRGQRDATWPLKASIERVSCFPGIAEDYAEEQFRKTDQASSGLIADHTLLERLAHMQHYGSPTRLLDWTWSADVAAFFAVRQPSAEAGFAIWAVDVPNIRNHACEMLGHSPADTDLSSSDNFTSVYRGDYHAESLYLVMPVEPTWKNPRIQAQQGLFIYAYNALVGFDRCLKRLLDHAKDANRHSEAWIHKLIVSPSARGDILHALEQKNITQSSLFPGNDLPNSLREEIARNDARRWPERTAPLLHL